MTTSAFDNVAYAGLTPMRTVSVLVVTEGNTPLRLGLSTPKAEQDLQSRIRLALVPEWRRVRIAGRSRDSMT